MLEIKNPFDRLSYAITFDKVASMTKAGDYCLPEDPAQWNASIQDAIETQLPEVVRAGSNPHIVYKHKDWGSKCALGSITIAAGGALLVFPIVIRYGNLAPFDMAYVHDKDKWIHTSEENMRAYESGTGDAVFGKVTTKAIGGDNEYEDRWEYLKSPRGYSFKGGSRSIVGRPQSAMGSIRALDTAMQYGRENLDRIYHTSKQAQNLFKNASEAMRLSIDSFCNAYDNSEVLAEKYDAIEFEKLKHIQENIGEGEITPLPSKTAYMADPSIMEQPAYDPYSPDGTFSAEIPGAEDMGDMAGETPQLFVGAGLNSDIPAMFREVVPPRSVDAIEETYEEKEEDLDTPAFKKAGMDFCDMLHIKKAGLNNYVIKMGRRGFNGVFEISGGVDKVAEYLCGGNKSAASKILDMVDDAQGILVDSSAADSNLGHIETLGNVAVVDNAKRITRFGIYDVFTEAGEKQMGHVIPVVDWNGEQSTMFLFISDSQWALQSNINGTISTLQTVLPNGIIRPERRGAFVLDRNGNGVTFPPIEVKSVLSTGGGMVVRGTDLGSMKGVNVIMSKDVPGVMEFTQFNDPENWLPGYINVYMPLGVKFVPLPSTVTKIATIKETLNKLNTKLSSLSPYAATLTKEGNNYYVKTDYPLSEYPGSIKSIMKEATFRQYDGTQGLSVKEAEFALRMGGAIMADKVVQLVKEGRSGKIDVPVDMASKHASNQEAMAAGAMLTNYMALPSRYKMAAKELRLDTRKILDVVTLAPNLRKIANDILAGVFETTPTGIAKSADRLKGAEYQDEATLDDLFELGFLNDKNLLYYTQKIQDIEDIEDFLCKVLMAVRIAGFGMEEDSAQNALYGISELKNILAKISFRVNRTN